MPPYLTKTAFLLIQFRNAVFEIDLQDLTRIFADVFYNELTQGRVDFSLFPITYSEKMFN